MPPKSETRPRPFKSGLGAGLETETNLQHYNTNTHTDSAEAPAAAFSTQQSELKHRRRRSLQCSRRLFNSSSPLKTLRTAALSLSPPGRAYLVLVRRNKIERLIWIVEHREGQLQHLLGETKRRDGGLVKQRRAWEHDGVFVHQSNSVSSRTVKALVVVHSQAFCR